MIAIFSAAFFFGLIAAVVSGIVWIVQRLRHRQTRARVVCIVAVLVTVVGIVGISVMYEPTETVEEPPVVDNTEPAQDGTQQPTETPAATPTPVITPEPEDTPQGTTEPPETSSVPEETEQTQTPEPFEVSIDVSVSGEDGKPKFVISTNLPDETQLILTLNGENYTAQDKVTVRNGIATTAEFSYKGDPLSGKYTVDITMTIPRLQPESVRAIIGEKGENITGPYVQKSELFEENQVIAKSLAEFDF